MIWHCKNGFTVLFCMHENVILFFIKLKYCGIIISIYRREVITLDKIVLAFANLLSDILNPCMFMLAIAEIVIMIVAWVKLGISQRWIKNLLSEKKHKRKVKVKGKVVEKESAAKSYMNWDEYKEFQISYKKAESWYTAFSLIIQLFTLLGILGTVAGLYISLSNGELNSDNIYVGVGFALSSTIIGIILAIIFKAFDIFISSVLISPIDSDMEIFEKDYNVSRDDNSQGYEETM